VSRYLDASVILPTIVDGPASAAVDAFIIANLNHLVISDFAAAEVAAALSRLVLMHKMDAADAAERMADFDAWRAEATDAVEVHASDVRLSNVLVRRFDLMLRAPDALHAAICRRTGDDLVTLVERMANAASALGIAVVVPGK
jgi:predicted nucleic acid-binding protein